MSEPQVKRRVRKRSISLQLQLALDDAARAMTADISAQKLIQTRIDCLLKMQARDRNDKLRKLSEEIGQLKRQLAEALAAKQGTTVSHVSDVEQALARYNASKIGGEKQ